MRGHSRSSAFPLFFATAGPSRRRKAQTIARSAAAKRTPRTERTQPHAPWGTPPRHLRAPVGDKTHVQRRGGPRVAAPGHPAAARSCKTACPAGPDSRRGPKPRSVARCGRTPCTVRPRRRPPLLRRVGHRAMTKPLYPRSIQPPPFAPTAAPPHIAPHERRPAPPQPAGLSRQPGHHPLRPARAWTAMLPWFTERYGNPHSVEHVMGTRRRSRGRGRARPGRGADRRRRQARSCSPPAPPRATTSPSRAPPASPPRMGNDAPPRRHRRDRAQMRPGIGRRPGATEGFEPVFLPVRPDGLLDPDVLREALAVPTLLVSVMAVNNEIGVIQDIAGAGGDRQGGRRAVPHRHRAGGRQDPAGPDRLAASISPRSAATSSTGRRASARCSSAAARACGWRRCSPAAGRSAGCAPARCRRR